MRKTFRVSAILSVGLFASLSVFSFISAHYNLPLFGPSLIWNLVISGIAFCIFYSGSISKYRSILFILIAFFFFLEFKLFRFINFGKTEISPYCHIAQAPTLFSFIFSQFRAVTSGEWQIWGVLTLGFLWLAIIATIGQGICSWVCFYGGIDEAFSKVAKKPLLKLNIPKRWRDFPVAFLIFLLIVSFLQGLPVFCNWFCPFKVTEDFWGSYQAVRIAQAVFFWLILAGFVIIIPILTGKRTFCALLCPFGAFASLCGKVSPYKVTVNRERCTRCGKCRDVCSVMAIEDNDAGGYRITDYCNKCGRCIEVCPSGAINILIKKCGQELDTRTVFIFLSLLVTGVISGTFVPQLFLKLMGSR